MGFQPCTLQEAYSPRRKYRLIEEEVLNIHTCAHTYAAGRYFIIILKINAMLLCIDLCEYTFSFIFPQVFLFFSPFSSPLLSQEQHSIIYLFVCLCNYVSVYISFYVIYLSHCNSYYAFPAFTWRSIPSGSLPKGEKKNFKKRQHNFHFNSNFLFSHFLLSCYLFIMFEMPWLFLLLQFLLFL